MVGHHKKYRNINSETTFRQEYEVLRPCCNIRSWLHVWRLCTGSTCKNISSCFKLQHEIVNNVFFVAAQKRSTLCNNPRPPAWSGVQRAMSTAVVNIACSLTHILSFDSPRITRTPLQGTWLFYICPWKTTPGLPMFRVDAFVRKKIHRNAWIPVSHCSWEKNGAR